MSGDLYYRVSVSAGAAAYDLSHDLTTLTVDEEASRPHQLVVELSDPYKVLSHALQEGMEVEVDLGAADDHSIVFRGRIYKVDGSFPETGVPRLTLTAYDGSMRMGLRERNRPWTDMALSALVEEIAGVYFNGSVVVNLRGDPEFTGNGIRQQDETDLAFLLRLGARYGAEMFVISGDEEDALHFDSQHHIMTAEPEITLYHGRCGAPARLIQFEAGSDVGNIQLPRVFSGIDYESGEATEATTAPVEEVGESEDGFFDENLAAFSEREPDRAAQLEALISAAEGVQESLREELGGEERIATPGFVSQADLDTRAENQFSTSIQGMRGSGTTTGNHRIRAQSSILIQDVGGRFSGTWYLTRVRHVLNQQGYQTEIECRR
ncbi:phage late control D family protein [Desulfococcus sp.]|uniref:phage late control D family protein n=1 Tax=Desulfococcus sp. TaxID=2025834 RepID=UPI003593781E